jgi:pimeloyl-ACP methyl ester carboxylesterase
MNLKPFAQAFATEGFAVICFDFRRWGASDGTRRNCLYISERLEDYRTVVKYCRQQEDFDAQKVVLWGYSFAGGHCLSLAAEPDLNVAAAIFQSPYTGRSFRTRWDHPMFFQYLFYSIADIFTELLGLEPVYMNTCGPPGSYCMLSAPRALEGMLSISPRAEDFPNQISLSAFFRLPFHKPRATASKITCPVLFIAPRRDSICPFQATLDTSREIPTAEVLEVSGDHFDMFPGGVDYGPTLKRELEFLRKHLVG